MDPITTESLHALVAAYERDGPRGLARFRDVPVLIHLSAGLGPDASGFSTSMVGRRWDPRMADAIAQAGSNIDPALIKAGVVYAIEKRKGGPFPDRIGIGRTRAVDISLRLSGVSKYHAYITHEGERWYVVDAESRNGTRVGDLRIVPGQRILLKEGVQVMFAGEVFLFHTPRGFAQLLAAIVRATKK